MSVSIRFDLPRPDRPDQVSPSTQRALLAGAVFVLFALGAFELLVVTELVSGVPGPFVHESFGLAIALFVFFVVVAALLLWVRVDAGERATTLAIDGAVGEFQYPSGHTIRLNWTRPGTILRIRLWTISTSAPTGPRKYIYCEGGVRAFLTPEAFDALSNQATTAGGSVRDGGIAFVGQRVEILGPQSNKPLELCR